MTKRCLNIAHRGASAVAPENTLIAFLKAVEARADMVELDVHLTRDGHLVVIHDKNVKRTTTGSGNVTEMTLEQIKRLDAGWHFSPAFIREQIPTLEEVIAMTRGSIALNIEVKTTHPAADLLVESLMRVLAREDIEKDVLISSFSSSILKKLRERSLTLKTGFICFQSIQNILVSPLATAKAIGANALHPNVAMVTPDLVKKAHEEGMAVNVWTEDDPKEMRRLRDMGVDGIITNNPFVLHQVLTANS